jgi:hypothetical protein
MKNDKLSHEKKNMKSMQLAKALMSLYGGAQKQAVSNSAAAAAPVL